MRAIFGKVLIVIAAVAIAFACNLEFGVWSVLCGIIGLVAAYMSGAYTEFRRAAVNEKMAPTR